MLVSSPSLEDVEAIASTPIPETIFPYAVLPEWFLLSFIWLSVQRKDRKADSS